MTVENFIDECESIFDKKLKPAQLTLYKDKLRRFSPEQLFELLNKVLEETKYFPKVSEIHKAATDLGFLAVDTATFRSHRWQPTDCAFCRGEGRLCLVWSAKVDERPTGILEIHELRQVLPYSLSFSYTLDAKLNEFRTIFRCKCLAGDKATIPKAWPKLGKDTPVLREVWL